MFLCKLLRALAELGAHGVRARRVRKDASSMRARGECGG